jgi:hypothetical protein
MNWMIGLVNIFVYNFFQSQSITVLSLIYPLHKSLLLLVPRNFSRGTISRGAGGAVLSARILPVWNAAS